MNRLLLIALFLFSCMAVHAQTGYLFVKKGIRKKKSYGEGDWITLKTQDHRTYAGFITLLRNDTIFINGKPVPRIAVQAVLLDRKSKGFHIDPGQLGLITAGVALTTAGLTLSKQAGFSEALIAGAAIGYGPLLVKYLGIKILSLRRKKYRIGKKFRLQVLDFYIPRTRGF